ncbi:MAG: helix-turn-helix transcriptional regulator [Firmicutes bacterium]|nr:helix-turn-helix transcriptional regulator [Bacillota bacterium]
MINGSRLKKLRKEKGLTQSELGEMLGVGKSAICCYEKELRSPSSETIMDLVNVFAVSADYILGTDELGVVTIGKDKKHVSMTKEEIKFIEELKKDKMVYDILFEDPKRGAELIKKKIG